MRNNKNIYALSFMTYLAAGCIYFSSHAEASCVSDKDKISFSVKVIPKNINYNFGISQKTLNQLSGRSFSKKTNQKVLGLTSTKQSISAKMVGLTNKMSSGLFCYNVTSVNIEIKILTLDVFVLGKYARGSCQYTAIIDHEHEHVATYKTGINQLKRALNNKLLESIKNLPPGISNTPKKAGNATFRMIQNKINQIKIPIEREMRYRDRQIDTPLNYKLLQQKCPSW
jgi:hypothetical protein